jgi:thiol:disulfide interchange protein DsbC
MKKLLLSALTIGLAITAGSGDAHAFAKGDQDCTKCHTLNAEQAKEVLKEIIPDVKILDIQNGPINGLWEVSMESGAKKGVLYLDYSKKNLVAGNIFGIKTRTNYTQQTFDKINKIDYSSIPLENSLIMGAKDAKHKLVVFDDPD